MQEDIFQSLNRLENGLGGANYESDRLVAWALAGKKETAEPIAGALAGVCERFSQKFQNGEEAGSTQWFAALCALTGIATHANTHIDEAKKAVIAFAQACHPHFGGSASGCCENLAAGLTHAENEYARMGLAKPAGISLRNQM